jgi:CTD kinase subunit beta
MITLERYLLEIVAFDFRARNPAEVLASLCYAVGIDKTTGIAALSICLDAHRTLAVLKQTRQTLSCACLELAARFMNQDVSALISEELYEKLGTTRGEVTGMF